MHCDWRTNKDFWAGVMFIVFGLLAVGIARSYPFGSTLAMGPGYFPIVLGWLLVCFGVVVMVRGLRRSERIVWVWSLRGLIILPIVIVAFGLLIERVGFVPSLAFVVIGSAAAGSQFRWGEVLLLTAGLVFLMVVIFIWGLQLPYPLFKRF